MDQPTSYIKNINSNLMTYKGFIEDEADAFKIADKLEIIAIWCWFKGKSFIILYLQNPVLGTNFEGFENLDQKFTESSLNADEFSETI